MGYKDEAYIPFVIFIFDPTVIGPIKFEYPVTIKFPDKFEFLGIKTSQLKQVGNAVPPLLAEALACKIKDILEEGESNVRS